MGTNDRESLIKALECCCTLSHNGPKCANCKHADQFHNADCETYLLRDVLALLKAQEPRVMTLEEVRKWEQPDAWMEFRKDGIIEPTSRLGFATIAAVVTNGTVNPPVTMIDGYGITWRCWTSRPTDEQRKAVKWDASTHKEP